VKKFAFALFVSGLLFSGSAHAACLNNNVAKISVSSQTPCGAGVCVQFDTYDLDNLSKRGVKIYRGSMLLYNSAQSFFTGQLFRGDLVVAPNVNTCGEIVTQQRVLQIQ
jgi:hypothetical protein